MRGRGFGVAVAWLSLPGLALVAALALWLPAEAQGADRTIAAVTAESPAAGRIEVSWTPPAETPQSYRVSWGLATAGYTSWRDDNSATGGNAYPDGGATSHTITGLESGIYRVWVRARYADLNNGPWAESESVEIAAAPTELREFVPPAGVVPGDAAPANLRVEVIDGVITLSWDAPVHRPEDVTGYQVLRRMPELSGGRELVVLLRNSGSTATTYEDHSSQWDRARHIYRVRAIRGAARTGLSPWVEFRPRLGTVLPVFSRPRRGAPPTGLRASFAGGAVRLSWERPASASGDVSYALWRERLDRPPPFLGPRASVSGIAGTSYVDRDLASGATYRYGVSATQSGLHRSIASEPVTVVIPPPLGDAAPGLSQARLGVQPLVIAPSQRRYTVSAPQAGGAIRFDLEANALDTDLRLQVVRADDFRFSDLSLGDALRLSAAGETLLLVRAEDDGDRATVYALRLQPPSTIAGPRQDQPALFSGLFEGLLSSGPGPTLRAAQVADPPPAAPQLSALSLGAATLTPAFNATTYEYEVSVAHDVEQLTVTAGAASGVELLYTLADADADTDGRQIELNEAEPGGDRAQTVLVIVLRSADRMRLASYTITVRRDAPGSNDASLSALQLSDLSLSPAFSAEQTAYTARVDSDTTSVTVVATPTQSEASRAITPDDSDADTDGHQIDLDEGDNPIVVTVTAEDGATTRTYAIIVTRDAQPSSEASLILTINPVQGDALVTPVDADGDTTGHQIQLSEGENVVRVTVTTSDGALTTTYRVTVVREAPPSTDAGLHALTLEGVTPTPMFARDTHQYAASVRYPISELTLFAEPVSSGASVSVSPADADPAAPGWQAPLAVGVNTIAVVVTAQDGVTRQTYLLSVTRAAAATADTTLSSLGLGGVTLIPGFSSEQRRYTAFVANDVARATISAAATQSGAGPSFAAADADPVAAGHQVNLVEGRNEIAITVTASDGVETAEYMITVFRTPEAANTRGFLQVDAEWFYFCFLRVDSTIACGKNPSADSSMDLSRHIPSGSFARVGIGWHEACAIRDDGSRVCWDSSRTYAQRSGIRVDDPSNSANFGIGVCSLLEHGDIHCDWDPGDAGQGQTVAGPFTSVVNLRSGACALEPDGDVRCWSVPQQVPTGMLPIDLPAAHESTKFKFIAGGYMQACGIRSDNNEAVCWKYSDNSSGRISSTGGSVIGAPAGELRYIDTGIHGKSCAITTAGAIPCTGYKNNSYWPLQDGHEYQTISLGWGTFACGLRTNGDASCGFGTPGFHSNYQHNIDAESPWRNNAELIGLALRVGGSLQLDLSPAFQGGTRTYTASVASGVSAITVEPRATNSLASMTIYSDNDGAAGEDGVVQIEVGENKVYVRVVSADRTAERTYTITVTRAAP